MRAVKFYNVRKDDFDDNFNLKPDAKMYPLYHRFYSNKNESDDALINDKRVNETLSSEDVYDNTFNAHKDKKHSLKDETGNQIYKDQPVTKRGYSAVGYLRGRDDFVASKQEILDNGEKVTRNRLKSQEDPKIKEIMQRELAKKYLKEEDAADRLSSNDLSQMLAALKDIGDSYNYGDSDPFIPLPFIVEFDPEDLITRKDITENNYDPWRDNFNELQLKRIKAKVLPKDILQRSQTHNDLRKLTLCKAHLLNLIKDLSKDFIHKRNGHIANGYYSLIQSNEYSNNFFNYNIKSPEALSVQNDIRDWFNELRHFVLATENDYRNKDEIKDLAMFLDSNKTKSLLGEIDSLINSPTESMLKGDVEILNKLNWKKFLDSNFNVNDPLNVSDEHLKNVYKDVAKDYKDYSNTQNAIKACSVGLWR